MALRTGHGAGRGVPRVEVLPADEQPHGVPHAPAGLYEPAPQGERDERGRFIAGARWAQAKGARAANAKRRELKALTGLGLAGAAPENLRPFLEQAEEFARAEVERLARDCGGGLCPDNARALVQAAARAMAGSCAAFAAGDTALGAKLGAELRSHLLGARELTVREAQGRPKRDPLADVRARVAEQARRAREEREGSK